MKLITSSSPHIRSGETTRRLMGTVLLALLPTLAAGVWFFGLRALLLTLVSVASCVASEWAFRAVTKSPGSIADGSAAVTGLLLALTLPATAPYWLAAVGGVFAIVVVKGLSGGLGQNIFNPALAARAFLMLLWPAWLVRYAPAGAELPLFGSTADVVSAATPLHDMVMPALPAASPADMLLGNIGGCIGEVSALALLIGGAILLGRKVISWRIPAAYLGTVAFLTLVFYKGEDPVAWMLYSLLGGGVMLGALFMATDYATSPALPAAQLVYGVGCGALTVLFRYFGLYPEGVTYAILLMNACAWALDKALPRCERRKGRMNVKALIKPVAVLAAVFVLLLALSAGLAPTAAENAAAEQARLFDTLLPGGAPFTEEAYNGEDTAIAAVHRGSTGYIVETVTAGYAGDITMLVAVDFDGAVVGAVVREMEETFGLGAEALSDAGFLSQLIWSRGELAVGDNVDALTGATVTSKAVVKAVNSASAFVTGADVSSSATEWGG